VEMTELTTGGMGFAPTVSADAKPCLDEKLEKIASEAARRKFTPEFVNRIDKIIVFHPLRQEQLEQILEIELARVQQRVMDATSRRFRFRMTPAAREFLLCEGTDLKYGARHLKRAIERYVVNRLARLVATDQVNTGDTLLIDRHPGDKGLAFLRDTQQSPSLAEMLLVASNSSLVPYTQVRL
jgi:ATP-dependent Clp protease ATP-binding subunit ClpB